MARPTEVAGQPAPSVDPEVKGAPLEPPPLVLVAGGPNVELDLLAQACALGGPIVAADSGAVHVLDAGHMPDFVIGDLDSIGEARARLSSHVRIEEHPRDKDAIDLELALTRAAQLLGGASAERPHPEWWAVPGAGQGSRPPTASSATREILIFAAFGGRLDQSAANLLLASHRSFRGLRMTFVDRGQRAWPLLGPTRLEIHATIGDRVSILPSHGPIRVGSTHGLRWPLHDTVLELGSTRGISNEMTRGIARIDLTEGQALIVHLAEA